ncbi:hypothetical protein [Thermanaeromonas sp. C210]|uniref:hypothetical protein n=1 Tax=Thermanaeromonas sp. C210 TaxID=2731925 RepID=UPI00155C92DB|nr:hypothetical protein [Thermanaeromonas sp. C210]GFN23258.1 hypothetical protein TAMC210_15750 [Thermanaeromonas sp. C210]
MKKGLILLLMSVLPLLLVACSKGEAVLPDKNNNEEDNLHKNITGVYGGQKGENAVAITIDEGIQFPSNTNHVTFELSREIKESGIIPALVIGDRVSFDCSFARGKWEIKRIAKLEAPRQTVSAVFVGWIDNNMIEAMVGGQPTPFWVAEEIKPEVWKAPEGAEMEFTYYEDGYGRLVLTEVKFK